MYFFTSESLRVSNGIRSVDLALSWLGERTETGYQKRERKFYGVGAHFHFDVEDNLVRKISRDSWC